MPEFRSLGRNTPAPLAPHRMLTRTPPPTLPQVVDLRKYRGPTKNQGNEGSCTGHSFSSGNEWVNRAYLKRAPVLSPQFFYAEELDYDGNFPNDDGSDGNTGCNVIVTKGCCEESLYPYVAGEILQPTAAQLQNALQYTLGAFHGLVGSQTALSVLGDPTPWVINIGFTVDDNFQSDEVAASGVYVPSGTSIDEGHEVLLIGYDIGSTPTLRPAGCPPAFLTQNSWGDWGWNNSGDFWMALSVLDAADTDLRIVHSGSPWA